jgi:hypothetical protein
LRTPTPPSALIAAMPPESGASQMPPHTLKPVPDLEHRKIEN